MMGNNVNYEHIINFVHAYLNKNHNRLYSNPNNREDLVSQCIFEIAKNIDRYDAERASLSTFLVPIIKCGVKNYYCYLFEKKENSLKSYFSIRKAIKYLESIGEEVTIANIAFITGFTESKIYNELKVPGPTELSFDDTIFEEEQTTFANPEESVCANESITEAMKIVSKLSESDQEIIKEFMDFLTSNKSKFEGDTLKLAKAQARARLIRDNLSK